MPSFTKGFNFGPKVCYASTIRKLFTLLYPFYFFAGNHCQTSRDTTTSGCSCRATRGRVSPPGRYGDFLDIYANVRHVRRYEDPRRRKSRVHPGSLSRFARSRAPSLLGKPEQQISRVFLSQRSRTEVSLLAGENWPFDPSPRRIDPFRRRKLEGGREWRGRRATLLFRQKGFNFQETFAIYLRRPFHFR